MPRFAPWLPPLAAAFLRLAVLAPLAPFPALAAALLPLAALAAEPLAQEPPSVASSRPVMTSLPPAELARQPPTQRALVDARAELKRRYRELLFRSRTSAGAERAADAFLDAAASEPDRAVKWVLCEEARRLGASSGNAAVIDRSVTLASATYDFDALDVELKSLEQVPLRALPQQRAMKLAEVAEAVATRAETDRRFELALEAQDLAIKAWQRAGAIEACRRAMVRYGEIVAAARR
jgi:hypothetical protein